MPFGPSIYSPIQLSTTNNWSSVAVGYRHVHAIDSNNQLWSCGWNNAGQLGLNTTTNYSILTKVGALSNWYKVACGYNSSAAIKTDGTLWAWGGNSYGQLGQGDNTNRYSPVQVGALNNYSAVYAMDYTIFAELI